jgi:hypothetical protein
MMDGSGWVQGQAQRDGGGRGVARVPRPMRDARRRGIAACTFGAGGTPGAAAEAVAATDEAAHPALPEPESSCIRPANSRPASRDAGSAGPGAAAADRLHFACKFSAAEHPAGISGRAAEKFEAVDATLRPQLAGFGSSCIRPAIRRRARRVPAPSGFARPRRGAALGPAGSRARRAGLASAGKPLSSAGVSSVGSAPRGGTPAPPIPQG